MRRPCCAMNCTVCVCVCVCVCYNITELQKLSLSKAKAVVGTVWEWDWRWEEPGNKNGNSGWDWGKCGSLSTQPCAVLVLHWDNKERCGHLLHSQPVIRGSHTSSTAELLWQEQFCTPESAEHLSINSCVVHTHCNHKHAITRLQAPGERCKGWHCSKFSHFLILYEHSTLFSNLNI